MAEKNAAVKKRNFFTSEKGGSRETKMLAIALIVLVIIMCIATNRFYQVSNIMNIFVQIATLGICALGAGLVMIGGGFNMSIGNVIAFSGCTAAVVMSNGGNAGAGLLVGIGIGALCGLANGLLVVVCKAEPFIVTLGMMTVYQGLALLVTGGKNVAVKTAGFGFGRAKIGGTFPVTIIFLIIIFVVMAFIIRYTKFGRRIYAIGDNEEAAYLSGIKVNRNKVFLYVVDGILIGIAAMLLLSRLASANAAMGDQFLMQSISAAVIGGVAMSGGKGSVIGIFLGTLLIGIVNNALNLLRVPSFWQYVVLGAIIVLAVFISNLGKKQR